MEMNRTAQWLHDGEVLYEASCNSCREMEQQITAMKARLEERATELKVMTELLRPGTNAEASAGASSTLFAPAAAADVRPIARVSDAEVMRAFTNAPAAKH